jgi:hypothetical protein
VPARRHNSNRYAADIVSIDISLQLRFKLC